MSIFEALMLICFGAAWPFSIYRSYKSKSIAGKSLVFLVVLLVGYISGIINKILIIKSSNNIDPVLYLYILNFVMVSIDTVLFLRNKKNVRKELI